MGDHVVRILHLLNSDQRRGAEIYGLQLARAMARKGVMSGVMALRQTDASPRLPIDAMASAGESLTRGLGRLVRLSRSFDVVVGHGGRTLFTGAAVSSLAGVPFIYRLIGEPGYWAVRRSQAARVALAARRCAALVAYYPEAARDLRQRYGLRANHVHVIPKGIAPDQWTVPTDAERREARRRFGLAGEAPVVAYVGSLTPEKNVRQAVEAVGHLRGARLLVAGEGEARRSLQVMAEASGVDAVFVGAIADVERVYAAADVLCLTSATEGVPTVLLEAALRMVPAVATEVGGIPQVVVPTAGRLVPVGDSLATAQALSEVIAQRRELGAAARARCLEENSLDVVAEQWIALARSVTYLRPVENASTTGQRR